MIVPFPGPRDLGGDVLEIVRHLFHRARRLLASHGAAAEDDMRVVRPERLHAFEVFDELVFLALFLFGFVAPTAEQVRTENPRDPVLRAIEHRKTETPPPAAFLARPSADLSRLSL